MNIKTWIATGALAVVVGGSITGATLFANRAPASAPNPVPTVTVAEPPAVARITFAAVGDSITAWIDRNGVDVSKYSWTTAAGDTTPLLFIGQGWAKGGAKLSEMAANVTPTDADVLVIMGGTNDEGDRWGTPIAERLAEVTQIVEKSGARRVLISTVAPRDAAPQWSTEWNTDLAAYAALNGWSFADPWAAVRTPDGHYQPGTTIEGIHPTPTTAEIVGHTLVAAIASAAR